MRVLVTGACGFVGSAVCAELRARGHDVVGVDALIPQAHGPRAGNAGARADAAAHRVDVRDQEALDSALAGVDVVCHQAAIVGAGVAVADLPSYAAHNDLGTATLLAAMSEHDVRRLVLASSMVVYGEGRYACPEHGPVEAGIRTSAALAAGEFDHVCPAACDRQLPWDRVDESAPLRPRTAYAASKVAQEHYAAAWAAQVRGEVVALRYHNVYGPWMPRDTPYSGVAAMFRSAVERGEPPQVYEDGRQMRDFVHVSDVARANVLAVEHVLAGQAGPMAAFNVCSGSPVSILEVAERLCVTLGDTGGAAVAGTAPQVTGAFRPGDVRHVVASPALAADTLGFVAAVPPGAGLEEFARAPLRRTS